MEGIGTSSNRILTTPELYHAPTSLQTLPLLDFTDPSHFSVDHTIISRTLFGTDDDGSSLWSSLLLSDPFTTGIVSVTITLVSLRSGTLSFGFLDSNNPIPAVGEILGTFVRKSVSLSRFGHLHFNTPSSVSLDHCHSDLKEGDCVRMEVDLDSTPGTVQFFVNGEAGERYVSGIPSSVRIGV
ncbi:hypothetical protein BLNAU_7699 [Blattamonas nauphoetae]|uniref:B30.2/SPRY domain-containing protein n=1 Tax=Blattamonas nauphoetae TaxID=2049346 RepID=A0ABQ9Y0Q6_9EUKA|nr:hypothetical protein BLNAU_7699 [Blattamonas nauphoetae]